MQKINYDNLMPFDIVFTTSYSWIANVIRLREVGPLKMFNTSIATHVGLVFPLSNSVRMFGIAEMLADGLKINSLSDYLNKGTLGDRIVRIARFPCVVSSFNEEQATAQIMQWWEEGKKYDFEGLLEFVLPFLKGKKDRFYCSELVEWVYHHIFGVFLAPIGPHDRDAVSPYDIQKCNRLVDVSWKL